MQGPVAIILAAGQGKRMKSDKAKVLHEVCGQPMIRYVVDAARGAGAKTIVVVIGYAAEQIRSYLGDEPDVLFATQTEQLGTGHAAKSCRPLLADYEGPALILVGDEPLLRPKPLADLLDRQHRDQAACLLGTAMLGGSHRFRPNPSRLGWKISPYRRGTRLHARGTRLERGQPELLRFRAARTLGRSRRDWYQQRPGRVLPDRRSGTLEEHGPKGFGAQRHCTRTTCSGSTRASIWRRPVR